MQKRYGKEGPARAWGFAPPSPGSVEGLRVIKLSRLVRLALPPLFFSSLPKKAIGFSYPSGREGRVLGIALVAATAALSFLLDRAMGPVSILITAWLTGGTAALILYNSTSGKVAFVKELCSTCRLRPVIEEHEAMHLFGEASEDAVWDKARKKYSYESLKLEHDPMICGFCPIAKRLKDN